MSSVHDTITEALRQHHDVRELHADGTTTFHCDKCCGDKQCVSHSLAEHLAHQAGCVLEALSAAGFVVRKQVERHWRRRRNNWTRSPSSASSGRSSATSPSGANYGGVYERRTSGWQCIAGVYKDGPDNGSPKLPCHVLYDPEQVEP